MTYTLRLNARNDLHLNASILKALNLGKDRILKAELKNNSLVLIPVDLEPRWSKEALEGFERLYQDEKKKGFIPLRSDEDVDRLLK